MNRFDVEQLELMKEGIRLFNAQKYWECHEEFEHHWLEEPTPMRNIYWAVIQVAAAMIHYRDGNIVGARGLINKAKEKFTRAENNYVESDLLFSELSWNELKGMVRKVPDEPVLSDFSELYEFRFKDPDTWKM